MAEHGRLGGSMTTDVTVWCGKCTEFLQTGDSFKKNAAYTARMLGWKKVSIYGWVCPSCAKNYPK